MEKKDITKEMLSEKGMLDVSKYSQQDNKFYSSSEWLSQSKRYIELHPFCEICLKENIQKPSDATHHITRISQGGSPYDENNLLAICKKCHGEIHTGICVRIDLDFINNAIQKGLTPENEWWCRTYDLYRDKERVIRSIIDQAKPLEKNEIEKSIELYYLENRVKRTL
jgi:hypothetical protein